MLGFGQDKNARANTEKINQLNRALENSVLAHSLDKNIATLKQLFTDVDILKLRYIQNTHTPQLKYCIAYCDGVVNSAIINDSIMKPLQLSDAAQPGQGLIDTLMNQVLQINEAEKTNRLQDIIEAVTYGDTILFAEGAAQAIILNTKSFALRAVGEPDSEKTLSGPREGFTESLLSNLSLLRRKIRSHELKMHFLNLGRRTRTTACVCYIDSIANKQVLAELYRRLETIDIDGVLDTNYITELIKDARWSPFRTTGYTERPDTVTGKLLEGRIALFLDGTPVVLTVPYLFIENLQSNEDYYLNFYYASFSRLMRILGFILTVCVPGLYIGIVAFHHELMPTSLLISIASERQTVPLPATLEAFLMLIVFDILKETGIRMPSNVGQALSIVGALVIGQAAVEAKLVAAPMIIVVAITGITSLLVPKLNAPVIYIRFFLLLLASCFGLYGMFLGMAAVFAHMLNLFSFGIPQFSFSGNLRFQDLKDVPVRSAWSFMHTRPEMIAEDKVRIKPEGDGHE